MLPVFFVFFSIFWKIISQAWIHWPTLGSMNFCRNGKLCASNDEDDVDDDDDDNDEDDHRDGIDKLEQQWQRRNDVYASVHGDSSKG